MLPGIYWIRVYMYFPNPFFISPGTHITTGTVVAFIPHIHSILISRSSYFGSLSVTSTEVLLLLLLLLFYGNGLIVYKMNFLVVQFPTYSCTNLKLSESHVIFDRHVSFI